MSGLTDIFNAGLDRTAKVLVADPLGNYSQKADEKIASAAKWFGGKLTQLGGYKLSDQISEAAKVSAAAAKVPTVDTNAVAVRPGDPLPHVTPIFLAAIVALLIWKFLRQV